MALNINTNLTNNLDGYLLDAKNIKGGIVVVDSDSDLANIPAATLYTGAMAFVRENGRFYRYQENNTWTNSNSTGYAINEIVNMGFISIIDPLNITNYGIRDEQNQPINSEQEAGNSITINKVSFYASKAAASGLIDIYDSTNTLIYTQNITSITTGTNNITLTTPQTISSNCSIKLTINELIYGHTHQIIQTINLNFNYYIYTGSSQNTTYPVSGLSKKGTYDDTQENGFEVYYSTFDYLYFYAPVRVNNYIIQQYVSKWLDFSINSEYNYVGTDTITLSNGTTATYMIYRMGPFVGGAQAGNPDIFRLK